MIDLRFKGLPDHITVADSPFLIKTDFRIWIGFEELLTRPRVQLADLWEYFDGNSLPTDPDATISAMLDFYINKNQTPRSIGQDSQEKTVDFIADGEYIVAAFMQTYHIDLTSVEYMHWHLFKALFNGLPEDTYMSKIMGYRCYKKSTDKDLDTFYKDQKKRWELRRDKSEDEKAILAEINAEFYNS